MEFNEKEDERIELVRESVTRNGKVGQDQLYNLLLSRELAWQDIIYDLINTGQLDPWDIDLTILAAKYLEKIKELEEANFFISSKVLLASSILLKIKSEILLDHYIRSLDEILFGKKEEKRKPIERIDFDEELPDLIPKTPLPRLKKVTLSELMQALDRAMVTEHRRIKREIMDRQAERRAAVVLPKFFVNLNRRIRQIYGRIKDFFKHTPEEKLTFSYLIGNGDRKEKIATFVPLLHLDNQSRVNLEQKEHFGEIFISLKEKREEVEELIEARREEDELKELEVSEQIEKEFREEKRI